MSFSLIILNLLGNDGHNSIYSLNWLLNSLPCSGYKELNSKRVEKVLWDASCRPQEIDSTADFKSLSNVTGIRKALSTILKYGFCLISNSPHSTFHGTQAAVEKISKISKIGPWTESTWELTSNLKDEFSDTAFTTQYLGPHTDGSYMLHAPGYDSMKFEYYPQFI